MENALVILIVALACVYLIRRFSKSMKQEVECGCGCPSCGLDKTCGKTLEESSQDRS